MHRTGRAALGTLVVVMGLVPALVAWAAVGDLDSGFGNDGMLQITDDDAFGWGSGVALFSDGGGIVAEGDDFGPDIMARFGPDGSLDSSFLGDGAGSVGGLAANDVLVLDSGEVLFAGLDSKLTVGRMSAEGVLDTTFGIGGVTTVDGVHPFGSYETPVSLVVDTQDRILVAGTTSTDEAFVVRLLASGAIDTTFGTSGVVEIGFGDFDRLGGLSMWGDRPVLALVSDEDMVVARLTATGTLDLTFASTGVFTLPAPADSWWADGTDVLVDGDGSVFVIGGIESPATTAVLALALDNQGAMISTYGDGGLVMETLDEPVCLRRAAFDHEGGIVATGYAAPISGDDLWELAVVRFDAEGELDPAFGIIPMAASDPDIFLAEGSDIDVDLNGDVVVSGAFDQTLTVWRFDGPEPAAGGGSTTTTTTSTSVVSTTTTITSPSSTTSTTIPATPPTSVPGGSSGDAFSDDDGSVYEEDIEWLAGTGITAGCNPPVNDLFCPNAPVTRGQMAAFLVRALGLTSSGSFEFDDDDDSGFETDIERLAEAGVTLGCNPPANTLFCPDGVVTRGQMAAFLHRAWPDLALVAGSVDFDDVAGSVFRSDIGWLARTGVTRGCSETSFCPEAPVTRGQIAAFLRRALTS